MKAEKIKNLKDYLAKHTFIKNSDEQIGIMNDQHAWLFDFRRSLLMGDFSDLITDLFYENFKEEYPFQIGSLEIGGVPLVTSIMNKMYSNGHHEVNAFFIRKSRKKSGLLRMHEGVIVPGKKIILVDDVMNSGDSFWRQIQALEEMSEVVDSIWSILRYQDMDSYTRFTDKGIKVKSLLTLNDFTKVPEVQTSNLKKDIIKPLIPINYKSQWKFKSSRPSLNYVNQKSQPVLDNEKIYFGSDSGVFYCINQSDGKVVWKFKTTYHSNKKGIWSSPVIYNNLVIFGSYDGNIYALNKSNGKKAWINFDGDFIGSSPAIDMHRGIVYLGMEFGLVKKHGGIIALNADTGKKIWSDYSHQAMTHASPLFIKQHDEVVIGSNEGIIRLYDSKNGTLKWSTKTHGGSDYTWEKDGCFGEGAIKMRCCYESKRDLIITGAIDGFVYVVNRSTGDIIDSIKCGFGIWSTPIVWDDKIYWSSVDKNLYCYSLINMSILWFINLDSTRIFADPVIINNKLFIGTNSGKLHVLDPRDGSKITYYQATERIVNSPVCNKKTGNIFLPTYANEIIKLKEIT